MMSDVKSEKKYTEEDLKKEYVRGRDSFLAEMPSVKVEYNIPTGPLSSFKPSVLVKIECGDPVKLKTIADQLIQHAHEAVRSL